MHLLDFEETAHGSPRPSRTTSSRSAPTWSSGGARSSAPWPGACARRGSPTLTRDWRDRLTSDQQTAIRAARVSRGPFGAKTSKPQGGPPALLAAERTRAAFAKVARRGAAITPDVARRDPARPAQAMQGAAVRAGVLRPAARPRRPRPRWSATSSGSRTAWASSRTPRCRSGRSGRWPTAMLAAGEAPAVTLLAMGEVTAGLAARQRAARADFEPAVRGVCRDRRAAPDIGAAPGETGCGS